MTCHAQGTLDSERGAEEILSQSQLNHSKFCQFLPQASCPSLASGSDGDDLALVNKRNIRNEHPSNRSLADILHTSTRPGCRRLNLPANYGIQKHQFNELRVGQ